MARTPPETYTLTFCATGDGPPLAVRVRHLLKAALRSWGLRCTAITGTGGDDPPLAVASATGHPDAGKGHPPASTD